MVLVQLSDIKEDDPRIWFDPKNKKQLGKLISIRCSTYSAGYGYIESECKAEFENGSISDYGSYKLDDGSAASGAGGGGGSAAAANPAHVAALLEDYRTAAAVGNQLQLAAPPPDPRFNAPAAVGNQLQLAAPFTESQMEELEKIKNKIIEKINEVKSDREMMFPASSIWKWSRDTFPGGLTQAQRKKIIDIDSELTNILRKHLVDHGLQTYYAKDESYGTVLKGGRRRRSIRRKSRKQSRRSRRR